MGEAENKARLIVKRFITHLASDSSITLGKAWNALSDDMRQTHVEEWTEKAVEVLGEKEDDPSPDEVLREICNTVGFEHVAMRTCSLWMEEGAENPRVPGPRREYATRCDCQYDVECEWCRGGGWLTDRVLQLKEEAEGKEDKPADSEEKDERCPPKLWELSELAFNLHSIGARSVEIRPELVKADFEIDGQVRRVCEKCGERIPIRALDPDTVCNVECPKCGHMNRIGDSTRLKPLPITDGREECPQCGELGDQVTKFSGGERVPEDGKVRWSCPKCDTVWDL